MKSFEELARLAWIRYCAAVGGKAFNGNPLPSWHELGELQKAGWIAAVQGVTEELKALY
jgi:hypothetical protein